jgi:hypothetical protein
LKYRPVLIIDPIYCGWDTSDDIFHLFDISCFTDLLIFELKTRLVKFKVLFEFVY